MLAIPRDARGVLARVLAAVVPPTCGVCSRPASAGDPLCPDCAAAVRLGPPAAVAIADVDWALAAAPYEGSAAALVAALKFRGRLALAAPIAAVLAAAAGTRLAGAMLVPVPPAPARRRRRGFDAAEEITRALSHQTGCPLRRSLRRVDGPRQVGRSRRERLGSGPAVRSREAAPERAVLVDDVVTTGATLAACAGALRLGGARDVGALAFARAGSTAGIVPASQRA